jgi:hypothetical protein
MSALYEAIGRLVVAVVSRRYRDELRLMGVATIVVALFAVLWGLRGRGGNQALIEDLRSAGPGARRKRRSGAFVSIR